MLCFRQHYILNSSIESISPIKHKTFSEFILCGVVHFNYPDFYHFLFKLNILAADDLDGGLIYWNWPWRIRKSTRFKFNDSIF